MKFIELTTLKEGRRFLFDIDSGWEIYDAGYSEPATWTNEKEGINLWARETYEMLRAKLLNS